MKRYIIRRTDGQFAFHDGAPGANLYWVNESNATIFGTYGEAKRVTEQFSHVACDILEIDSELSAGVNLTISDMAMLIAALNTQEKTLMSFVSSRNADTTNAAVVELSSEYANLRRKLQEHLRMTVLANRAKQRHG